jgi:hypothetical protein
MFSDKLPSPLSAPLLRFLPVLVSVSVYCTMHPSGSRSSGRVLPPARRSRSPETSKISRSYPCSIEPETPVRYYGPRKTSVPGRVQKRSTFMVGFQHHLAHGVVSKDRGLGSMSGLERLTNQHSWLFQQTLGFPVPAPWDYRNILASSNST